MSIGSSSTVQPDSRRRFPLSRYTLVGAVVVAAIAVIAALLSSGGGHPATAHTPGAGVAQHSGAVGATAAGSAASHAPASHAPAT
ncbi:MAG: hypothetical protein WBQ21_00820, partial [Solirubrobacteraceae bacterium]